MKGRGTINLTNFSYPEYKRCTKITKITHVKKKVKWSRYRPDVAQRVGRVIALLFHDRGTRRGWVVSSTPRLHFTPGKDPVPILQEAGWAQGLVWTGGKTRPHRHSIPDRPACSSVAIPTELPGPQLHTHIHTWIYKYLNFLFMWITWSGLRWSSCGQKYRVR